MGGGHRSAVIVSFAIPPAVEAIRRDNVPVARAGVPPHITILSPFVPAADLDASVRERLVDATRGAGPFDVRFAAVERYPDALYLDPEPAEPFRTLIGRVSGAFPDLPPYGDPGLRPEDVDPHLTIAIGDGTRFDQLAGAATSALPFARHAAAVTVIAEGDDGRWRKRWRLALRR